MKKSVSALCKLLLSSTLLWAVPSVEAQELRGIPPDMTVYCHPALPATGEDGFAWQLPVLDSSTAAIGDFYSSCDYGVSGSEEVSSPPLTEDFQESSKKNDQVNVVSTILRKRKGLWGLPRISKPFARRNMAGL